MRCKVSVMSCMKDILCRCMMFSSCRRPSYIPTVSHLAVTCPSLPPMQRPSHDLMTVPQGGIPGGAQWAGDGSESCNEFVNSKKNFLFVYVVLPSYVTNK